MCAGELRTDCVQCSRRYASSDGGAHVGNGSRDELSNALHACEVGLRTNRHVESSPHTVVIPSRKARNLLRPDRELSIGTVRIPRCARDDTASFIGD